MEYQSVSAYRNFFRQHIQLPVISSEGIPEPSVRCRTGLCCRSRIEKTVCYMRIVYQIGVGIGSVSNNAYPSCGCKLKRHLTLAYRSCGKHLHNRIGCSAKHRRSLGKAAQLRRLGRNPSDYIGRPYKLWHHLSVYIKNSAEFLTPLHLVYIKHH